MLESLSGLGKAERQSVLSSVALSLLPSPTPEPQYQIDEEVRHRVLSESREHLSLAADDDTPDARSEVVDFLGNQISESVLRGADFNRIKSRLGDKGSLLPSEYGIKITPRFREFMEVFQLDEAGVTETISYPDEIQHFFYNEAAKDSPFRVSLCTKSFGNGRDRHILVVALERDGYTMTPRFAWRIFFSEVSFHLAHSPLEVAKAFADRYGLRFQIGVRPPAKFYENEVVTPQEALIPQKGVHTGAVHPLSNLIRRTEVTKDWYDCGLVRLSPLGFIAVAFAFNIDIERYRLDMEKHGIKVASSEDIALKGYFAQLQVRKS